MAGHLILHRDGAAPERVRLGAALTAGGAPGDAVEIAQAPPGALLFQPSAAGVVVEARVPGARAAGRPLCEGGRRLLRPGERAEYAGHVFELPAGPPEATRALAGRLLREAAAGGSPIAGPHLVVLEGPGAGQRIPLADTQTLGRGRGAVIRVRDPLASRLHARLRRSERGFVLEDLASKNGLRVNGALLVAGARALRPGDEISIGSARLLLCDIVSGSPAHPAAPLPAPAVTTPGPPPPAARRALGAAGLLLLAAALGLAAAAP